MATRSTSRESASTETDASSAQNTVTDAARHQLASSAATASAMLRALDTYQQAQQHMLQRAAVLQEQMAERLRNASSPMEVMSIQSSMVVSGMTDLAQYAQELMLASLKAQNELMRPAQAPQAAASATPMAPAAPFLQAWQAMFTSPLNGAGAGTAPH
ncbi:phasin family protein [Ramlibacter rhizophilus]|uniref:Phasin domain-containing protein n=1 Tax=Ramlibacter rhizophilus TaxID=1781167 RepID=A0A4Z0BNF5_9BURK|nr:phasin family protein [Ramlibacter rhizophilus]TFY99584.1 hypothetical protein EZ242_10550 [Ramlibacter rhizophilus]